MDKKRFIGMIAVGGALAAAAAYAADPIIGPQVRIDPGGGTTAANETTIAAIPNEIVGSWNDWRAVPGQEIIRAGVALSSDGGATWTDFLLRPPANNQTSVEGDPMTAYDPRTGTLWAGAISFAGNGGVFVARKNPGQNTFQPSVMARATGGADKCWMAAGVAHNDPNATKLYITYNEGCLRSANMGATWSGPVSLGSGIGFLPRVGPNGEVYVAYWDFGSGVMLRRSFDGGQTFQAPIRIATRMDVWGTQDGTRFPGIFRVPSMNYLAVDPKTGTLYCVYFDTTNIVNGQRNVDLYFTKSTNQGANWTTPRVINGDNSPPGDQFWPWLEVDRRGRIHMCYWDSRHTVQNDDVVNGMFDTYYSYSDDGGTTWRETRLTPNSFNSNNDGLNRGDQFMGDYNGLAYTGNISYPCYLSTQAGNPDVFTHIIFDPTVVPDTFAVTHGALQSGNAWSLTRSDDDRLVVRQSPPLQAGDPSVGIEVRGNAGRNSASSLGLAFELSCNGIPSSKVIQRIEMFNYQTATWEQVDQRNPSPADNTVSVNITTNASRFINATTKEMTARVRWFDQGTATPNWGGTIDVVEWTVNP